NGEGANGERELEVAVRPHPAEGAHGGSAADGLERGDVVDGGDLWRTRDGAAREGGLEELGEADLGPESPLDRGDEMRDPGELVLGHEVGPADRAGLADTREVVPLEVDDHHVLGRVLLRFPQVLGGAERTRPLDRLRPDASAAAGEE